MDSKKAIAALEKLSGLYWGALRPDTFSEREPPDDKFVIQITTDTDGFARRIDRAQRELLATGFPVPNTWLTVDAVPIVSEEQWRVGNSETWRQRVEIRHPKGDLLRGILEEMYAARMRLEAGGGADPMAATSLINDPLPPGEACMLLAMAMGETDHTSRKVTARYEKLRPYVSTAKKGKVTLVDGMEWRKVCSIEKGRRERGQGDFDMKGWRQRLADATAKKEARLAPATPPRTFPNERARKAALKNGV